MTAIHFMVDWQRHRDLPQTQIQTQTETETDRILHTQCCLKCTCVCVCVSVCGCVCNVAYSCWFLWPHSQCNRALIDTVNDMHIMFACACACVCVRETGNGNGKQSYTHAEAASFVLSVLCLPASAYCRCMFNDQSNVFCLLKCFVSTAAASYAIDWSDSHIHTNIFLYNTYNPASLGRCHLASCPRLHHHHHHHLSTATSSSSSSSSQRHCVPIQNVATLKQPLAWRNAL